MSYTKSFACEYKQGPPGAGPTGAVIVKYCRQVAFLTSLLSPNAALHSKVNATC